MTLTNQEYMVKFNQTTPNKNAFQKHLEVCGIKTKNDKTTRAKKFLWGVSVNGDISWKPLTSLPFVHMNNIRAYLYLRSLSDNDESVKWVIDLIVYAQDNALYR